MILIKIYGQVKPSEARKGQGAERCSYCKENKVHYLRLGQAKCTFGKLPLCLHGAVATWEIVTWVNVHLGSCHFFFMGKLPLWKLSFWKLPLGKLHIWEVAIWENSLGKLPLGKRPLRMYLTSCKPSVNFKSIGKEIISHKLMH